MQSLHRNGELAEIVGKSHGLDGNLVAELGPHHNKRIHAKTSEARVFIMLKNPSRFKLLLLYLNIMDTAPIVIGQARRPIISGFFSMKRLGVFLLPLNGILVHRRLPPSILSGCPQAICWFPFIHLGGERYCEMK